MFVKNKTVVAYMIATYTIANIPDLTGYFVMQVLNKIINKEKGEYMNNFQTQLPQMFTIKEIAEKVGLKIYFVRQLVLQNKIKYVKAGRKYLINLNSLIDFLNTGENQPETSTENIKIRKVG